MADANAGYNRRGSSRNRARATDNNATTPGTAGGRVTRSMSRASSVASNDAGSDAGDLLSNPGRRPHHPTRGRTNVGNGLGTIPEATNSDDDQDDLDDDSVPDNVQGLSFTADSLTDQWRQLCDMTDPALGTRFFVSTSVIAAVPTLYNMLSTAELLSCSWVAVCKQNKLGYLAQWSWHRKFVCVIACVTWTAHKAFHASVRERIHRLQQSDDLRRAAHTEYEANLRMCLKLMLVYITDCIMAQVFLGWFQSLWSFPVAAVASVCLQWWAAGTDAALLGYTGRNFNSLKWMIVTPYTLSLLWAGVLWTSSLPGPSWHIAQSYADHGGPMGGDLPKISEPKRCSIPAEFVTLTSAARIGSRTADVTYAVFDCNYRPTNDGAAKAKNSSQSTVSLVDSIRVAGVDYKTITTPADASSSASISLSFHASEEDVPSSLTEAR